MGGLDCLEKELKTVMTVTGKSYGQMEFTIILSMLDNLYARVKGAIGPARATLTIGSVSAWPSIRLSGGIADFRKFGGP